MLDRYSRFQTSVKAHYLHVSRVVGRQTILVEAENSPVLALPRVFGHEKTTAIHRQQTDTRVSTVFSYTSQAGPRVRAHQNVINTSLNQLKLCHFSMFFVHFQVSTPDWTDAKSRSSGLPWDIFPPSEFPNLCPLQNYLNNLLQFKTPCNRINREKG